MSVVQYIECTKNVLTKVLNDHNLVLKEWFDRTLKSALFETIKDLFVIQLDESIIGLIDYNLASSGDPNEIEIQIFEVIEKGKGYGRMIINDFIQQQGLSIDIIPINGSEEFWKTVGFQPYTDTYYRYNMK